MSGADILSYFSSMSAAVPDRDNSSNQGGGLVNTVTDNSKYGNTNELSYQDSSLALYYAPSTTNTTMNYIMLTDSFMSGSARTDNSTPGTINTQQQQSAAQTADDSNGLDLPGIIIPVAAVAVVGGIGYAFLKSRGGKK